MWTREEEAAYQEFLNTPEPDHKPDKPKNPEGGWRPRLNPTQQLMFDDGSEFVLAHGEKGCRTADALVYTEQGIKRLGDMMPDGAKPGEFTPINEKVVSFADSFGLAKADGFWVEPGDEALRVELENGAEITGSHRHPLWVCWDGPDGHDFGYKSFAEMRDGQVRGVRYWTPLVGHTCWGWEKGRTARVNSVGILPATAYAIGALVGDGSLNISTGDHRPIGFTNSDKACINAVNYGLSFIASGLHKTKGKYQFRVKDDHRVLKTLIRAMGIDHLSYDKRIPKQIIEGTKATVCAFLSGLFDTDGTVDKCGNVQYCTVSENLSRDVQDVLAALGILCVRRPKKSASGRPTWTLSMMGKHADRFGKLIGFQIWKKHERIKGAKITMRRPVGRCHNRYSYPKVISRLMKAIALGSRLGIRDYNIPIKFRKRVGKRMTAWYLNRGVPWQKKPILMSVRTQEEAESIERTLEAQKRVFLDKHHRSGEWHDRHRHLHSFGSIPCEDKLRKFCALYNCEDKFLQFMVSDVWLEVKSITETKAKLYDLHVPSTHSFLASGTINHNSGKTVGASFGDIRHAYENNNALVLIISPSIRAGGEGVWYDIENLVLPAFRDGNRDPKTNELLDEGMGLVYTDSKLDPNTKDRIIWVGNKFGGWSKLLLISIPYASMVEARIKGPAPSRVHVEELTDCDGQEYFTFTSAQLGRRRGITGPQQFVGTCNPKGQSSWVYKRFWDIAKCEPDDPNGKLWPDGIYRKRNYAVYHVPIQENVPNLPDGYVDKLKELFADDPIQLSRLLDGVWIDMPTGKAMFKPYFSPLIHVVGDARKSIGLVPVAEKEFPILVSYDPGPVNFSIHLQQFVTVNHKPIYLWFDELNYVGKYIPYPRIVAELISRMWYWVQKMKTPYAFEHIADEAAFNHMNPSGSHDAADIERLAREYLQEHPEINIKPFKLKPCPKGDDSVPARSRMLISLLQSESIRVSAMCTKSIDMFTMLECEDEKPGRYDPLTSFRPKRSPHLHSFDSGTYAPFYFKAHNLTTVRTDKVAPRVFVAGAK